MIKKYFEKVFDKIKKIWYYIKVAPDSNDNIAL